MSSAAASPLKLRRYHHGSSWDFDQWADLQNGQEGAEEWSYKNLNVYVGMTAENLPMRVINLPRSYFKKFENYLPHADFPQVDVSLRSNVGPVKGASYSVHRPAYITHSLRYCEQSATTAIFRNVRGHSLTRASMSVYRTQTTSTPLPGPLAWRRYAIYPIR